MNKRNIHHYLGTVVKNVARIGFLLTNCGYFSIKAYLYISWFHRRAAAMKDKKGIPYLKAYKLCGIFRNCFFFNISGLGQHRWGSNTELCGLPIRYGQRKGQS